MDYSWLQGLLEWIRLHPAWFSVAICGVAFAESLAIVGLLMPGAFILFGFGTLVGVGVLDLKSAWIWCTVGAFLGDGLSFLLGRHFKDNLTEVWPFSRYRRLVAKGQSFFARHGIKSIFIGRFVGPVRPIIPVTAGAMSMPWAKYLPASLIASILWAPAYLLPGVAFGASIELAAEVAGRLALLIAIVVVVGWGIVWLVARLYNLFAPRASAAASRALVWLQLHPRLGRLAAPLVDPTRPESGSLALMAMMLLVAGWSVFGLIIAAPLTDDPLGMDYAARRLMEGLRSPLADPIIAVLAAAGHLTVILPASGALLLWLLWRRRLTAAAHWTAAVVFGLLLSALLSFSLSLSDRSSDSFTALTGVAGLHTGLCVSVYGFLGVLLARELPHRDRIWPYALAALLAAGVIFANLYFGVFNLSDLLAMALLAVAWVALLGLAYRRRVRRSFWVAPPAVIFYLIAAVALGWQGYGRVGQMLTDFVPKTPAISVVSGQWWQSGWRSLPRSRSRYGPGAQVAMNIQYAGDLESLKGALFESGWAPAVTPDFSSVLQYLRPQPERSELPILPAAHRGQSESLVLTHLDVEAGRMKALRLWRSPLELQPGNVPVWIGSLGEYVVQQNLYFFAYWGYQAPHPRLELPDTFITDQKQATSSSVLLIQGI